MSNCQELQKKLKDLHKRKDKLTDLLDQYQQTESRKDKQNLTEALDNFSFEDFSQYLQEQVEGLLAEHPLSQKFEGKLSFENGKVVITDELDFSYQDELYLPSIIDKIKGSLNLRRLKSVEYLELPDTLEGSLDLRNLESAENLELPDRIEGTLNLFSLESAEHLELPDGIKKFLFLNSLKSAEHLELPDNIKGGILLDSLSERERKQLRDQYPSLADQIATW